MSRLGRACAVLLVVVGACSRAPASGSGNQPGSAASKPAPSTPSPPAAATATPSGPVATVTLAAPAGPVTVTVEVVRSPALLEKGLMYRRYLPPDRGMLFLMGEEDDHRFWMRNTLIPLDIVFITKDLTVAGVVTAQPLDLTSRGVDKPSLYVLEVNAGWMAAHGLGPGAKLTFANVEAAAR